MAIQIINSLWIGKKEDAFNNFFLESRNINLIINVSDEIPFIDNFNNIEKIRIPISDKFKDYEDKFKKNREMYYHLEPISIFIKKRLSIGKNILVHCNKGKYRSTCIIISFLLFILKKELKTIYGYMNSKYSLRKMEKHLFLNALQEFEKNILK